MIDSGPRLAIERALCATISAASRCPGGDINEAHRLSLSDGRTVFAKTNPSAPAVMFAAESRGLAWLRETSTVAVPAVLAVSAPDADDGFLVLEYLPPVARCADFDARLGRELAAMHRFGAPAFGLDHTNFIATIEQSNSNAPTTWSAFYVAHRLVPLVSRAVGKGGAPATWHDRLEALARLMPSLVDVGEPPSRLHGDLWAGNVHVTANGRPCLIDPAVYGGHREMDLAMLDLFGGLSATTLAAYREVWPLEPDFAERIPLCQLYPLLVHVALFGGSYVGAVERVFDRYGV